MSLTIYYVLLFCAMAIKARSGYISPGVPICDKNKNEFRLNQHPCDAKCSEPRNYYTCETTSDAFRWTCRCKFNYFRNDEGVCVKLSECPKKYSQYGWTMCEQKQIMRMHPLLSSRVIVECDSHGNFKPKKCFPTRRGEVCYCVDPVTGAVDHSTITGSGDFTC